MLVGQDRAPLPIEFLLHALAVVHHRRHRQHRRGARRDADAKWSRRVEGDINLLGILGLSNDVRNGYQRIRVSFSIDGDAPPEKLQEIVEQSRARSAVFDVLTNGVPVSTSRQRTVEALCVHDDDHHRRPDRQGSR